MRVMEIPVTVITMPMRVDIASLDHVDDAELDMVGEADGGGVGCVLLLLLLLLLLHELQRCARRK
jgi:hypothetical protein